MYAITSVTRWAGTGTGTKSAIVRLYPDITRLLVD
jgi:hypothetical protein